MYRRNITISKEVPEGFGRAKELTFNVHQGFGYRLQKEMGFKTPEWLSEKSGVQIDKLTGFLADRTIPTVDELIALAKALGVTEVWLAEGFSQEEHGDNFAAKLRKIRGTASIEEFADSLNVSIDYILSLEKGESEPGYAFLKELLLKKEINPQWLFEDFGPMKLKSDEAVNDDFIDELVTYIIGTIEDILEKNCMDFRTNKKAQMILLLHEELTRHRVKKDVSEITS